MSGIRGLLLELRKRGRVVNQWVSWRCEEQDISRSLKLIHRDLRIQGEIQQLEADFLVSEAEEFCYFLLFRRWDTKEYVGLYTHGRRCGTPKLKVVSSSMDYTSTVAAWNAARKKKTAEGYERL